MERQKLICIFPCYYVMSLHNMTVNNRHEGVLQNMSITHFFGGQCNEHFGLLSIVTWFSLDNLLPWPRRDHSRLRSLTVLHLKISRRFVGGKISDCLVHSITVMHYNFKLAFNTVVCDTLGTFAKTNVNCFIRWQEIFSGVNCSNNKL